MSNWVFVAAAFAATWLTLLGFMLHLRRTMRRSHALLRRAAAGGRR
jgi:CcmD family protein